MLRLQLNSHKLCLALIKPLPLLLAVGRGYTDLLGFQVEL
jgi:hypothetical protein